MAVLRSRIQVYEWGCFKKATSLLASSLLSGDHEVRSRSPRLSDMMFQSNGTMAFLPRHFKVTHELRHLSHKPSETLAPFGALCQVSCHIREEMTNTAGFQHSLACGCIIPGRLGL